MCTCRSLVFWMDPTTCCTCGARARLGVSRRRSVLRRKQRACLIIKVAAALLRHHEIVLHRDGQTVAGRVRRKLLAALRQRARRGLVRHPAGQPLVVREHAPRDLVVRPVKVHVGQDQRRKRRARRARDEPVDAVLNVDLPALELLQQLRQMHAARAPVPVLVKVDIKRRWAPDRRPVRGRRHVARRRRRDQIAPGAAGHPVPLEQDRRVGAVDERGHRVGLGVAKRTRACARLYTMLQERIAPRRAQKG